MKRYLLTVEHLTPDGDVDDETLVSFRCSSDTAAIVHASDLVESDSEKRRKTCRPFHIGWKLVKTWDHLAKSKKIADGRL